ncbi:MAG: tetratricopeptide repeat protein [Bacteroidota bacterium]
MMGLTFREQDKVNNAINAFQTAVENDPDLIDAWIILGKLYQSKDNPVAIQYFDNAVRLDSSNISAHHTRANYLQQAGQLEKAIAAYRKITLLDPDYSDAYFNTGLAYLEMDSVALALRHFDLVVKTDPTNAQGYYFRGVCAERSGEFQKAKQDFQQTLSFDPEFEEARAALNKVDQQLQSGS